MWGGPVLLQGVGAQVGADTGQQGRDTFTISLVLDLGSPGLFPLYLSVSSLQPVPPQVMDHPGGAHFPA